jgi:hypothetical protein
MQVRKVVTRSGRGFRGYFPSKKLNRMIHWESILERDAIHLFEQSPGVISFQEQPALIHYEFDGETKRYFPDFELILSNGEMVHVEVKPNQKLASPDLSKKLTAIALHYEQKGISFKILTDDVIRREPRLKNIKMLNKLRSLDPDLGDLKKRTETFLNAPYNISLLALSMEFGKIKVLEMLSEGFLTCDLNLELDAPHNYVHISAEADHASIQF